MEMISGWCFWGGTGNHMRIMIDAPRELNIVRSKALEKRIQDSNTFSRLFQAFLRNFIPLEVQSENRFADFTLTKSVAVASPQKGRGTTEQFC